VQIKDLVHKRLRHLIFGFLIGLALAAPQLMPAADAPTSTSKAENTPAHEAPIVFWNRQITMMRSTLAGAGPQERAERAVQRLKELPLNVKTADIEALPIKVEGQDGMCFAYNGRVLFFLGTNDLDKESGETLAQASQPALLALGEALEARKAEQSWPVVRGGLLFTFVGLGLLLIAVVFIAKAHGHVVAFLRSKEHSIPAQLRLFGVDLRPHVAALVYGMVRTVAWLLGFIVIYVWLTLSLRRFPYTEPWGRQLGSYVIHLLEDFLGSAVHALPGFFAVAVIFALTRWLVRLARAFFDQVANGSIRIAWMDADIARATQRVFSAIAWIFAVVVAYPYIPGSGTDAFKGISVFFGLVISLGSTGIINQIMSGLFVVYSKALKTGEWVKVNETEGEVIDVGLLAAKVRTIEGQEVTIPNSVLVGTSTTNYSRLGHPDGMIVSSTVTIGYNAPWRQVHGLLTLAADRTSNIRKRPEPYVLQRQLSDFYVEYTLIARLENEHLRIETLSQLHSQIQDAFNEVGVQIMSPHFMMQPDGNVLVPPSKWHASPSGPSLDSAAGKAKRSEAGG
jgi:small-conductance mechanosensitive channel